MDIIPSDTHASRQRSHAASRPHLIEGQPSKPAAVRHIDSLSSPGGIHRRVVSGVKGSTLHAKPVPKPLARREPAVPQTVTEVPRSASTKASYTKPHEKAEAAKKKHPKTNRRAAILYSLAAVLFIVGGVIAWQGFVANKRLEDQVSQASAQAEDDGSRPSEEVVAASAIDSYTVGPTMPRLVHIEKLGVKARIMPLGVTSDNKLKAPSNVHDAGWYNASALPGQPGAMLVDGHVSSWSTDGVFKNLHKLVPGDVITIERGDGELVQYKVVKSTSYETAETDMNAAMTPITQGKNGLNLITCHGEVKPGTSEFAERLIVFAEQI